MTQKTTQKTTENMTQNLCMDLFTVARTYSNTMHAISRAFVAQSTLIAIKSSQSAADAMLAAINQASSVDSWSKHMKNSHPFDSKSN